MAVSGISDEMHAIMSIRGKSTTQQCMHAGRSELVAAKLGTYELSIHQRIYDSRLKGPHAREDQS